MPREPQPTPPTVRADSERVMRTVESESDSEREMDNVGVDAEIRSLEDLHRI